jgi:hypothetical protein
LTNDRIPCAQRGTDRAQITLLAGHSHDRSISHDLIRAMAVRSELDDEIIGQPIGERLEARILGLAIETNNS